MELNTEKKFEYFYHFKNLPALSDDIINEALNSEYFWSLKPNTFKCDAKLFKSSRFFKLLEEKFGWCNASYIKNFPFMLYDWHIDQSRSSSLNWVIKTNPKASTFYRDFYENDPFSKKISESGNRPLFWKLQEVDYTLYKPTILNTSMPHCVINNSSEERIILSVSVHTPPYNILKDFLCKLEGSEWY